MRTILVLECLPNEFWDSSLGQQMSRNKNSACEFEKRSKKCKKKYRKRRIKKIEKRIFFFLVFYCNDCSSPQSSWWFRRLALYRKQKFFVFIHNQSISYSRYVVVSDIFMFFIHGCLSLLIPHWALLSTPRWDF